MADAACASCGAKLSRMDRLRSSRWCATCARKERDWRTGTVTESALLAGLVTVEQIALVKRAISKRAGVSGVTIASGKAGTFRFTISHEAGVAIGSILAGLPGVTGWTLHDDAIEAAAAAEESAPPEAPDAVGRSTTESVLVDGLTTVEDVVRVKRLLAALPGVTTVTVSSRPGGTFQFALVRAGGPSLESLVGGLPGVSAVPSGDPSARIRLRLKR